MDTDSSAEIDQQQAMANHPLEHFLVLQALFRYYSSPGEIKRNRLVSRSWKEASTDSWLKLDKYPVLRYSDLAEHNDDDLLENGRVVMTLAEFYSLHQSGDPTVVQMLHNPPQKLVLYMWQADNALGNSILDKWFWTWVMSSSLHKMTLVNSHFKQGVTVFKESFLRGLPNLGELTLRNCIVNQEALRQINEEHNRWMEYPGRQEWIMTRRFECGTSSFDTRRALRSDNIPYNRNSYRHGKLVSLDVALKVAPENDDGTASNPPLRIWGPLLAMLPCLRHLRIGGYEETDAPPPQSQLKQLGGDDYEDCKIMKFESFDEFGTLKDMSDLYPNDRPWIGRYIHDGSPITLPNHIGYFWELFWEQEIGQVESELHTLDLLDLSGKAQEYGVLSACESMDHVKKKNGRAEVFKFSNLKNLAFDLGLDATFAENDLRTLNRWLPLTLLRSLHIYRAPFGNELSGFPYWDISTYELKLWGNVSPNLNFLATCQGHRTFRKLIWITSCFENEFYGKRLHHLLKSGKQATPLMRQDLAERTDWELVLKWNNLRRLYHLEMDWGPMSLESWGKLGNAMPNLRFLKGIVADDNQLELIVAIWPGLQSLKFAHGSRVTTDGLLKYLPKLKLIEFEWAACACTQEHFQVPLNIQKIRQVEMELKKQLPETDIKLPWKLQDDAVEQTGCILAEWENALLTGNSTRFFELYKNTCASK